VWAKLTGANRPTALRYVLSLLGLHIIRYLLNILINEWLSLKYLYNKYVIGTTRTKKGNQIKEENYKKNIILYFYYYRIDIQKILSIYKFIDPILVNNPL